MKNLSTLTIVLLFISCSKNNSSNNSTNNPSSTTTVTTVTICSQVWMQKNLDVATYRNGDAIPKVLPTPDWNSLTTGAYCYYNNDSATYAATYGKLYNWYAVNDPRGLAPAGWHIPSEAEWSTLTACLGGAAVAGGKMKEIGKTHWSDENNFYASNSSGFTGLPGGFRGGGSGGNTFDGIRVNGCFWSSTTHQFVPPAAWYHALYCGNLILDSAFVGKGEGYSVRCVKD